MRHIKLHGFFSAPVNLSVEMLFLFELLLLHQGWSWMDN